MAKKYLAFLGALPYQPCVYPIEGQKIQTPFVQIAIAKGFCRQWGAEDRLFVFTTPTAKSKNWHDSEFCEHFGLERRLRQLDLPCPYEAIDIPENTDETGLWEIFGAVFDCLEHGDEIIFDITHSFRYLPLLAVIILQYAQRMKQCRIQGVYYGAFEAKVAPADKPDAPKEEYEAPIFDLTPFMQLFDWNGAIERFLGTGDASALSHLIVQKSVPYIRRISRGEAEDDAQNLITVADATRNFSKSAANSRGRQVVQEALNVQQSIHHAIQSSEVWVKPLTPLLKKIEQRFQVFSDETDQELQNMFEAVRWCLDHQLNQQGLTLLQEAVLSHFCRRLELDETIYHDRQSVSMTLVRIDQDIREHKKSGNVPQYDRSKFPIYNDVLNCLPDPPDTFLGAFKRLKNARNKINHATSDHNPDYFKRVLERRLDDLQKMLL